MKAAIAKITAAAPTTPATAATDPVTSTLPSLTKTGDDLQGRAPSAKDLKADALAALQKAVDTLLAAVTSGDVSKVLPAATAVVTGLVDLLAATLLGGGLPAPDLPGLPALPSLPVSAPSPPVSTSTLPVG